GQLCHNINGTIHSLTYNAKGESGSCARRHSRDWQRPPMLNPIINIFIPTAHLLTLSDDGRLGPIQANLLAIGIPATYGIGSLIRNRKVNAQSILGIISVLLTGVIAVFRLDTTLFPVKEAIIPIGFAIILVVSNRTSFPIVKLLFD